MKRFLLLPALALSFTAYSQNVGVDVATPLQKLDVAGGLRIGNTANNLAGSIRYNGTSFEGYNGTTWVPFGPVAETDPVFLASPVGGVTGTQVSNWNTAFGWGNHASAGYLTTLNGLTGATQSFATGTAGTAPGFASTLGVHTLNIPFAATPGVTGGVISNAQYNALLAVPPGSVNYIQNQNAAAQAASNFWISGSGNIEGILDFRTSERQMINLYGAGAYGIGVQAVTNYFRTAQNFAWHRGGVHTNTNLDAGAGGSTLMVLLSTGNLGIGNSNALQRLSVTGNALVSGVYLSGDGAVGAPAYSFNSSQNTGIFRPAGAIAISTAGVERLRFTDAGVFSLNGLNTSGANRLLTISAAGVVSTSSIDPANVGTVSSFAFTNANGVSGSVSNPTTTPNLTITLGAITPSSVAASGTVTGSNLSGTNTGDQTITLTSDVTGSGTGSFATTIANGVVNSIKITDNSVASIDILDNTIASVDIADGTIATVDIANNAIDGTKIGIGTTAGDVLYYNGTDWLRLAAGANGTVLRSNGVAAPSWISLAGSGLGDNLGNHTATTTLAMGAHAITSSAGTVIDASGGWHRSYGNTGFFNGTHSGGIWMDQATYVRVYNGKGFTALGDVGVGTETPFDKLNVVGRIRFGTNSASSTNPGTGAVAGTPTHGIGWGNEALDIYGIYVGPQETINSGNYTKLVVNWHTGIKIGALSAYGGVQFYNNAMYAGPAEIMSIGKGDNHVRVNNYLFAQYLNSSDNSVASGVTGVIVKQGDNYYRTATAAALATFLATTPSGQYIVNNGSGDWNIASSTTATGYSNATLELRESNYSGAGGASPRLSFHWGGVRASQIALESNGTIAIRNNPGTGYEMFRCLTIRTNGIIEPSDMRLKKNINPITGALDKVMAINGVTYNWRKEIPANEGLSDGLQYGLIAQELEKIIPELVNTDEEGWKSVEYSHLVPVLIEALKEQQQQIEAQKAIISSNEASISSLMEFTKRLEAKINSVALTAEQLTTGSK